jgi:DNA-binding response OmpR family regulator
MIMGYLREKGYKLLEASNGLEALQVMGNEAVDLVILDLMMPHLDGEGFLKAIRPKSDVYIIVLTARTGEDEQVRHYSIGADDYVEKPFGCKALASKVAAVFSRLGKKTYGVQVKQIHGIIINESSREICIDDVKTDLKPKEYDLLVYLTLNQGIALSREQILDQVWGVDYIGSDRTVDIHISNLRKKLGRYESFIQTLPGYGYKFEVLHEA